MRRSSPNIALFLLLLLFLAARPAAAAETAQTSIIPAGEKLDIKKCVDIALSLHPDLKAAAAGVAAGRGRFYQARSEYFPRIDASLGYSRNSPAGSPKAFDAYAESLSATQSITDFGRTSARVEAERHLVEASSFDLDAIRNRIVFNVKAAYYEALMTARAAQMRRDALKQAELHLKQAQGFFDVGKKPRIDVTRAEVDAINAKVEVIKADNAARLSRMSLENAMGITNAPAYTMEDELVFSPLDIALDEASRKALESRPEIKASAWKRRAAEENLNLAGKGHYPELTGSASYERTGETGPNEEGWNAGIKLTIPIFNGLLVKYQVAEARARLDAADADLDAIRQNILLEVRRSWYDMDAAKEKLPAAELAVKSAAENLDLANGRYEAGVADSMEVTDAELAHTNARLAYLQTLADYLTAIANLEKTTGSALNR